MAHIIYICHRDNSNGSWNKDDFKRLSRNLTPDHITATELTTLSNGILFSIISYNAAVQIKGTSVALGNIESAMDWWKPGGKVPDGAYALFRGNNELIELVTDIVASRSIWYVRTEEIFIASTSQRAIVAYLGSFHPNPKVYPWVLSSGCLGPDLSWDLRIQKLRGDSRVSLNRQTWELSEYTVPARFEVAKRSESDQEKMLEEALNENFQHLKLDWDKWALALSGGYDSRFSFIQVIKKVNIDCITWCSKTSLENKTSDARIARELSQKQGVPHKIYYLERSNEPIDLIFDRFIKAMEGRIDHITTYMDGFRRFQEMKESGLIGIIRGDEAFGSPAITSEKHSMQRLGLRRLGDYSNTQSLGLAELGEQVLPEYLLRLDHEPTITYHDRLYQEFRMPTIISALGVGKLYYIEQVNPLLSRRVIEVVRSLPDHLRRDKILFTKIVNRLEPNLPIASNGLDFIKGDHLLGSNDARALFISELEVLKKTRLLPDELIDNCHTYLTRKNNHRKSSSSRSRIYAFAKKVLKPVPQSLKAPIKMMRKPELPIGTVILRSYIISRMDQILKEDAQLFRRTRAVN